MNIVASILPQKTFIDYIGKDKVNVLVLVKSNHLPHYYEPLASDMRMVSSSNAYFSIGVEFENIWLKKIVSQNKNIKIFKTDKNIKKISITNHHGHTDDPHIWLSPSNVKIIAKNILDYLIILDSKNKSYYTKNYKTFIKKIINTDKQIKKNLQKRINKHFMVIHPSWGYFAKDYGLSQLEIEVEGKGPSPRGMIKIIKKAKKNKIKTIISTPETSDKLGQQIAKILGIKVIKISPVSSNWSETLIYLSKVLSKKL